jgi:hypothetical protein
MQRKTVLTCALALCLLLTACPAYGAPELAIDESEFNFGYVPQDARITHVFWLKSVGDEVLKITKVVPGCGCTKAPIDKTELAMGDSTRLEVKFNTKGYRKKVTKAPRIETNVGPPHKKVHFTARVVSQSDTTYPIIITPFLLDLPKSGEKARDVIEFRIANVSDADLDISVIDRPEGYFDLKLPHGVDAGGTVQGYLKLREDLIETSFEKSITIELNDELSTRFTIPVKRTSQPPDKPKRAQASRQGD